MRHSAALVALFVAGQAEAGGLQFQCGGSYGYGYFAKEGIFADDEGWSEDQISKGETVVDFDLDALTVDYRYKNAAGIWKGPKTEGGTTTFMSIDDDASFVFMSVYPPESGGAIEIVTIAEIDAKAFTAIMLLTQVKNTSLMASSKILKSDCKVLPF